MNLGQTLLIARRRTEGDTALVDLVAPDGAPLPAWQAGAHIDVGIGPDLIRQYSLCGDPADRSRYRLGILRDPASRGGSVRAHELFQEGSSIRTGVPRNLFPLHIGQRETLLIGGGIGITPLLAMAHDLHRAGHAFRLHYCIRSRSRAAFLTELAALPFADRVSIHADDGAADQRFDPVRDLPAPEPGIEVHFCGPNGFMTWLEAQCLARRYSAPNLHQEHFSAEIDTSGGGFTVELAQSGLVLQVGESQTILQTLRGAGIRVETMCQQGICGTCLTGVLDGVPDHRDSFLTDEERAGNALIAVCCSRSKTERLVLDL
ncbi:PDR/VanB family oxidoreductase [Rhodobacter sp. 24-YEA-8]|uniref:PDR/VanB family oxidoreductase n=1 Tax=Rhodobacter sp. 24-YEA-8 TaxID=1884310 RepID=UPI00089C878C|nr:PDR/VanB family oxidoreductase [Rhodobacter sp. 24-YEA-8]SED62744.1 vanillate O-demethylase ferredoxin subunit [Rhodobacter sp. 24-YEA-8]